MADVAAFAALGQTSPQLTCSPRAELRLLARKEMVEIIMQMVVYAGLPAALTGLFAAQEVFAERDRAQ